MAIMPAIVQSIQSIELTAYEPAVSIAFLSTKYFSKLATSKSAHFSTNSSAKSFTENPTFKATNKFTINLSKLSAIGPAKRTAHFSAFLLSYGPAVESS